MIEGSWQRGGRPSDGRLLGTVIVGYGNGYLGPKTSFSEDGRRAVVEVSASYGASNKTGIRTLEWCMSKSCGGFLCLTGRVKLLSKLIRAC